MDAPHVSNWGCGQIRCLDHARQTYKASRDQRGLRVRGGFDGCVRMSVCSELVMKESRASCDGQDSGIHIVLGLRQHGVGRRQG